MLSNPLAAPTDQQPPSAASRGNGRVKQTEGLIRAAPCAHGREAGSGKAVVGRERHQPAVLPGDQLGFRIEDEASRRDQVGEKWRTAAGPTGRPGDDVRVDRLGRGPRRCRRTPSTWPPGRPACRSPSRTHQGRGLRMRIFPALVAVTGIQSWSGCSGSQAAAARPVDLVRQRVLSARADLRRSRRCHVLRS